MEAGYVMGFLQGIATAISALVLVGIFHIEIYKYVKRRTLRAEARQREQAAQRNGGTADVGTPG